MKNLSKVFLFIFLISSVNLSLYAHCQIPCGIYDDHTRFILLKEHLTTIEKSMKMIKELSSDTNQNMNQLVRWINNKDDHANEFTHIVTYYFLAQRIKIKDKTNKIEFDDYQNKITLLHQMIVYSMKCKQTVETENVDTLRSLVDQFEDIYFTPDDKKHLKEHH